MDNAVASARAIVPAVRHVRGGVTPVTGSACWPRGHRLLDRHQLGAIDPDPAAAERSGRGKRHNLRGRSGQSGELHPDRPGLVAAMDLLASGGQAAAPGTPSSCSPTARECRPFQVGLGILPPGVVSSRRLVPHPGAQLRRPAPRAVRRRPRRHRGRPVLKNLPAERPAEACLKIADPRDLRPRVQQLIRFAQEAKQLPTAATGPGTQLSASTGAERLTIAVLTASAGADRLHAAG